jgi:hypothetical protein
MINTCSLVKLRLSSIERVYKKRVTLKKGGISSPKIEEEHGIQLYWKGHRYSQDFGLSIIQDLLCRRQALC